MNKLIKLWIILSNRLKNRWVPDKINNPESLIHFDFLLFLVVGGADPHYF